MGSGRESVLVERIQTFNNELSNQKAVERNIDDNLRYRRQGQDIQQLKDKEAELREELSGRRNRCLHAPLSLLMGVGSVS